MDLQPAYDELIHRFKETRLVDSVASVLGWDERTYMPAKGGAIVPNRWPCSRA